jgi:hypothetical protein
MCLRACGGTILSMYLSADFRQGGRTTWMQTIRTWSETRPISERARCTPNNWNFRSGRIALVHLAPVILHKDFLGTVSIFRDITHEVEVDRLEVRICGDGQSRTAHADDRHQRLHGYPLMGAAGALNENQMHFLNIVAVTSNASTRLCPTCWIFPASKRDV